MIYSTALPHGKMINEYWIEKDVEWQGRDLF
jgi:hypothetical protein